MVIDDNAELRQFHEFKPSRCGFYSSKVINVKSNDYVKYLTVELLKYMDEPRDVRKANRQMKKVNREPRLQQWFGLLPMSLTLWGGTFREKINNFRR